MKRKIYIFLFSLALTLSLGSFERVSACGSCSTPSFCEIVGEADIIFVGKVVGSKIQRDVERDGVTEIGGVGDIYFQVQQSFLGVKKGSRVTVRSGNPQGLCGKWFKYNETYLVFGFGDEKKGFTTGVCTRTTLISEAQDDLESLRSLPKKGSGSMIFGKVMQIAKSSLDPGHIQPLSGLSLKFQQTEGQNKIFETFTNSDGIYEIKGIPAGKYRILPNLSTNAELIEALAEVKDRGCVNRNFFIENKTKISGTVSDVEGKPVKKISVELIPADLIEKPGPFGLKEVDITDEDGDFTIDNVPPGRYTLSVNYTTSPDEDDPFPTTFYPNATEKSKAIIFDIGFGSPDIENIKFRLPPRLEMQEIKGIVVWSDVTPVFDAHVRLNNPEDGLNVSGDRTDKFGNFTLRGFFGRKYYISANNHTHKNVKLISSTHTEDFIFNENVQFFRLVLEKKE